MASIALMIGGAVVNALAFSGSSYLFSRLGHGNAQAEQKRHDEAVEKLQAAQAAWQKKRTEYLDWLNDELRRQQHAIQTFQDVDQAMREYSLVTGRVVEALSPEPQLPDFYAPSEVQKEREIAFIVLGMAVVGFVTYKISKRSAK